MKGVQDTPQASNSEKIKEEERSADVPKIKLTGEDPPEPGSIYIISHADSSQVITYDDGKTTLSHFDGNPLKSQKWVCHHWKGWLGFASDANPFSTTYLGHDPEGILVCRATIFEGGWERFCVRKRALKGFDILLTNDNGLQPLADRGNGKFGKHHVSETWWGFTKVG